MIIISISDSDSDGLDSHFLVKNLSDRFLSHLLLNTHIKHVGETDTGDVYFSDVVEIIVCPIFEVEDEIDGPVEESFDITKSLGEVVEVFIEELDKLRPLFGWVVSILGTTEECGREGVLGIVGLFVHDVDGFLTDHEKSEFSLLDSGQELHIDYEIFFDDVVLLAELEESLDGVFLDVIIDGLSAPDPGAQG